MKGCHPASVFIREKREKLGVDGAKKGGGTRGGGIGNMTSKLKNFERVMH